MNSMQKVFLEVIFRIANTPGVFDYGNSIRNPFRLFISRFSLANDEYFASKRAYSLLAERGATFPLLRSWLKKNKEHFTYEHPIPSSFVLDLIIASNRSKESILSILMAADCVAIITKEEDRAVSALHRHTMPAGWCRETSSPWARYELAGIEVCDSKIRMRGAIQN